MRGTDEGGFVTLADDRCDKSAFNRDHAAAVTTRHVCMAEARNDRCIFAEMR